MKKRIHQLLRYVMAIPFVFIVGCGRMIPHPVQPGDTVHVTYTCRNQKGEVVATLDEAVGKTTPSSDSTLFAPPAAYKPIVLTAQESPAISSEEPYILFEDLIRAKLSEKVLAMKKGERGQAILDAKAEEQKAASLSPQERTLVMAKRYMVKKSLTMPMDLFLSASGGKNPVPGMMIPVETGFEGRVIRELKKEVLLDLKPTGGMTFETYLGKGVISNKGDQYQVDLTPEIGRVVRIGNVVGVVSKITEKNAHIDFGNPFGKQTLTCDIYINDVIKPLPVVDGNGLPDADSVTMLNQAVAAAQATGKATIDIDKGVEIPHTAQKGDLVTARVRILDDTGRLIFSTLSQDRLMVPRELSLSNHGYSPVKAGEPLEFFAGMEGPLPGIHEEVLGMKMGTRKSVVIPPEKGFGPVDASKKRALPRTQKIPKQMKFTAAEYVDKTHRKPVLHDKVDLNPYLKAEVTEMNAERVVLTTLATDGKVFEDHLGKTVCRVSPEAVALTLTPNIGADFPVNHQTGKVVSLDGDTFTVDFNHPLAGKRLTFDITLMELKKASTVSAKPIQFQENYKTAQELAKKSKKPFVLVLYASWCSWSQRFLNEVLTDPRIQTMGDRFVWMKIDSSQEEEFSFLFKQESFPMIVLMNSQGEVMKNIEGFQPAGSFYKELSACLENNAPLVITNR